MPVGSIGESIGYSLEDEKHTRASYFQVLEHCGFLSEQGCPLPLEIWKSSFFFLPFKVSANSSSTNFTGLAADKVLHKPTITGNRGKASLFLRFKKTTTYIVRLDTVSEKNDVFKIHQFAKYLIINNKLFICVGSPLCTVNQERLQLTKKDTSGNHLTSTSRAVTAQK